MYASRLNHLRGPFLSTHRYWASRKRLIFIAVSMHVDPLELFDRPEVKKVKLEKVVSFCDKHHEHLRTLWGVHHLPTPVVPRSCPMFPPIISWWSWKVWGMTETNPIGSAARRIGKVQDLAKSCSAFWLGVLVHHGCRHLIAPYAKTTIDNYSVLFNFIY